MPSRDDRFEDLLGAMREHVAKLETENRELRAEVRRLDRENNDQCDVIYALQQAQKGAA